MTDDSVPQDLAGDGSPVDAPVEMSAGPGEGATSADDRVVEQDETSPPQRTRVSPGILGLFGTGSILVSAAALAVLWWQRREVTARSASRTNLWRAAGRTVIRVLPFAVPFQRQPPTRGERLIGIAQSGRDRARGIGVEIASRVGQRRGRQKQQTWRQAGTRVQGAAAVTGSNRFTVAALMLSVGLLGVAWRLDRRRGGADR